MLSVVFWATTIVDGFYENQMYKGEMFIRTQRLWKLAWVLSLLVISCTYLTPFFFEWIPFGIFLRDLNGVLDWSFSSERFWKSPVVPHCFFSGYLASMLLVIEHGNFAKSLLRISLCLAASFVFFLMLEIVQVFIPGRTISGGDVLIHWIACVVGAIVGMGILYWIRFLTTDLRFSIKFFIVWVFILLYLSIYPIALKANRDVSLVESFWNSLNATPRKSDVIANLLLGVPTGWLLMLTGIPAVIANRTWLNWGYSLGFVLVATVSVGLFVETAQHFFALRFPSLFDVLFQAIGSLAICIFVWGLRINPVSVNRSILHISWKLDRLQVMFVLYLLGYLVFQWTPWVPSLEMSTVKEGILELLMPLTENDYPWDLHWQSQRFWIISVFLASGLAAVAWNTLLRSHRNQSILYWLITLGMCFFGVGLEIGKVFISTKHATPLYIIASVSGGVLVLVLRLLKDGWIANSMQPKNAEFGGGQVL